MGFTVMLHHKLEGINSACVTLMETRESGASTFKPSALQCWLTGLFKHFPSFLTKDTHFPSVSANNDFYRLYLSGHPLIYIQRCLSFLALKPVMWYGGCFVYHISMDDIGYTQCCMAVHKPPHCCQACQSHSSLILK